MGRKLVLTHICIALVVLFSVKGLAVAGTAGAEVKEMTLQAEVGKVRHGYVLRGTDKAVIFTVLNPEPALLDKLADNGKAQEVKVHIISGDNVNIETIDGKPYPHPKADAGSPLREISLQAEVGKVRHGYVLRGTDKSVIFTVLNPEPALLDKLADNGKAQEVKVHIVSGDNVNIETIDGKPYPHPKADAGSPLREISLQAEVGKVRHGYVLRGTDKSVIFTVLNPEPALLDKLADNGKAQEVKVHIVSGDNVNIETIGGKDYPPKGVVDPTLREMTLQAEVGKVRHGYVLRGTDKAVIFTVLNPEPALLDKLADNGKAQEVKVHIVSGDNVNIEKINGESYPPVKSDK